MKIYLDDERETPEGWHRCYWPEEVIQLLKTQDVEVVSLDHDLGEYDFSHTHPRTGYDVIKWIEEQVATTDYVPPKVFLHTANSAGRQRMAAGLRAIQGFLQKRDQ